MMGFNAIETVSSQVTSESKSIVFTNSASVNSSQIMVDNEGICTVYVSSGGEAATPTETPARSGVPVLPMHKTQPLNAYRLFSSNSLFA